MARFASMGRAGCIALPVMFASGVAAAADIVETAQEAGSFQTLLTAAEAAGLVDTLKSEGPFTVFAPTDEAFAKLPTQALAAELRSEPIHVLTLCPGPTRTAFGRRAGFSLGSLPGAFSPETVARQGLDALGRRPVHVMGPVSRSLLAPGLTAQHVVTQGLGVAMRLLGRRGLDQSAA